MKSALKKDTFREIRKTFKRFLSILLMAMLGVAVYVGISAAGMNMRNMMDHYFDDQEVFDIKIMSTLGLSNDDVKAIEDLDGVNVYGTYEQDIMVQIGDEQQVFHAMEYSDEINKVDLVKGKAPVNEDECIIEEAYAKAQNLKIGDTITITDEYEDDFHERTLTITGLGNSPLYTSDDKGNSTLGSGKIDSFLYVNKDNFNLDTYTSIYITVDGAKELASDSNEYEDLINSKLKDIQGIQTTQIESRRSELLDEALEPYTYEGTLMLSDEQKQEVENAIPEGKWYVQDRSEANDGYNSWIVFAENIDNITTVFPPIFFAVATLMSLTAMTRMVDEERTEIGTLKALGYKKSQIASKFVLYASLATIIGTIIGIFVGFELLTNVILNICLDEYVLPLLSVKYDWMLALFGFAISMVCIVGGAIYASQKKLRDVPATLMRPEAPKSGKRVFLERITFIWKRLSFTQKVTLRNIFRYKKRFLMAIVGICGATSLVMVGFGVDNSISELKPIQYEEIYKYEMMVGISNADELDSTIDKLEDHDEIKDIYEMNVQSVSLEADGLSKDVSLMVLNDNQDISDYINIRNSGDKKEIKVDDDSVVLTKPMADTLSLKVGDTVTIKDADEVEKEVTIGGIAEQYISHNLYMSSNLYEELYGEASTTNVLLVNTDDLSNKKESALSEKILEDDNVTTVNLTSDIQGSVKNMDFVIIILIVVSGMLTFLVLYNLSNVNINERMRELATLKVLGFYNGEVDQYVNREMMILSVIGIAFGLVGGTLLNFFVLRAAANEYMTYPVVIKPISYLFAFAIVFGFTIIVNIVSHYALKKIDMIESLKSVE
ncbi:ABC transporter permease [Breznakia pachnodae]|uniref:ABC transport system permease protein n=1 Tax=Breznakia pachnodae TaxID=265178 RepID=A0ABU0E666_9FIRM|nr:ABC transporter permease [Breznakia pachnodae]MDQ0362402.1 putative ABC transport system permease protein [Breznakia pachnodae]